MVSTFPCDGKDTSSILVYWILLFSFSSVVRVLYYESRGYRFESCLESYLNGVKAHRLRSIGEVRFLCQVFRVVIQVVKDDRL